jgi:hypothetical protein
MFHLGLAVLNDVFERTGGNQEQQTAVTLWERHGSIAVAVILCVWEQIAVLSTVLTNTRTKGRSNERVDHGVF